MDVQVEMFADGVIAKLDSADAKVTSSIARSMVTVGLGLESTIKSLIHADFDDRTGAMARATFHRVEVRGDEVVVIAGGDLTKAPYYRIQDKGGKIVPKTGKYLTIPVGEALTGKGVARFTAAQVITDPDRYGYSTTFTKNGVVFGKSAEGIAPLFVLRPSVTLRQVGFLAQALRDRKDWAIQLVRRDAIAAINGAS